jgi:hypothetical protein
MGRKKNWLFLQRMIVIRTFSIKTLFTLLICSLFFSCSREEQTSWDIDVLAPLAETRLTVENLIADSLIASAAGEPILIRYESRFNLIPNDSLYYIPDTSFSSSFSLPFSINLPAGFEVVDLSQIVRFNYKDVQLSEAIIESGIANFKIFNTVSDKVYIDYSIPNASILGQSLAINNVEIAAGSNQTPSILERNINLNGYLLNLRGDLGNLSNQFRVNLNAKLNPDGNGATTFANLPLLTYQYNFKNIRPYFVRGYLGRSNFTGNDFLSISEMKKLSGIIHFQDITLNLEIENSIGADFSLNINNILASRDGSQLQLIHPIVGNTQQLSRAKNIPQGDLPYTATYKNYNFNSSNSNIKELIETLPDRLSFEANASLNPLGNVSSGNDFLYKNSNVRVKTTLEMPLSFSANALTFTDTLTTLGIESTSTENILAGDLQILATNSFPFDLSVKGYLLDENKVLIDSLLSNQTILAATVNDLLRVAQSKQTTLKVPVSESLKLHLSQARFIVIKAKINTQPENTILPMYADYELHLQLIGNGKYRVKI